MKYDKIWKVATLAMIALVALMTSVFYYNNSTTIVILTRHAEPDSAATCSPATVNTIQNRPLLAAGELRAQELRHVVEDTGIQAVYASELCRTQQTVEDTATALGLTVNAVAQHAADGAANVDDLVNQVNSNNTGQKVLIAGHTDTVPMIIEKLGGGAIDPITGNEFDNLYVVTIHRWWLIKRVRVIRLKYGAAS